MKKTVSLLLVLSLLLAMLAGCSSDSGKDKSDAPANSPASSQPAENTPDDAGDDEIKVALIVKSLTNSFWMMAKNAAEAKGAELGITVEVFAITEETDYQAQVNTVEDCVNKNFDVIAIVPADSNALVPACKAAVEAGVKVLAIDTDLGEAGIATSFIGSDNVAGGKMAAEYVIDQIGTEGAIAVIRGSEAQTVEIQRYTGFSEEIAASLPDIKAIPIEPKLSLNYVLIWKKENALNRNVKIFADYMTQAVSEAQLTDEIIAN